MNCPKCHCVLTRFQSYCPSCGAFLGKSKQSSFFGWLVVLGALFSAALIFILNALSKEKAVDVVRDQLASIKNREYTEAYYAFTSKEFQAATSLEEFKKFLKSFSLFTSSFSGELETLKDQNQLKVISGVLRNPEGKSLTVHYQMIDQGGRWKVLNIKAIPGSLEETASTQMKGDSGIEKVLQAQLEMLNQGFFKESYENFSSEEFKKKTSYESFKQFLAHFPIFTSFIKYELLDLTIDENKGIAKLKFKSPEWEAIIDYTFIKVGEKWWIQGIQVMSQESTPSSVPDFNAEALLKPLNAQIESIRVGHIAEAYEKFFSKAFQQATSLSEFESFIKKYSVFHSNRLADFYKLSFNNNIALYNGRFTSQNGEEREVEYALVKENGEWKILKIQIFDPLKGKAR